MNEPGADETKGPDQQSATPRKSAARGHWRRNAVIGLIGAPVLVAGLTVGGFSLFTRIDARDPNPREFQFDGASSGTAYYRVRIDYRPRQGGDPGRAGRSWARELGASLFDEGLTTTLAIDIAHGQGPVQSLARWRGDGPAGVEGPFTAYRKQNEASIAVTLTRVARPRLRWDIDPPRWATDILAALVPRAGADQPPLIHLAPPAAGEKPASTTIVVRDYKGIAIGDLHVTSQWRPSVLFDPALVQAGRSPNPAIESFVNGNPGAARRFAVLRMIRSNGAGFAEIAALKAWVARRFAAGAGNLTHCAETHDAAIERFALSPGDAALLTYFLHRDGPGFANAAALATACGREYLGAALRRIGVPPAAKAAPPPARPAPVAAAKATPKPRLGLGQILRRLAREWKAGLASRTDSARFIRVDAKLVQPNRFGLFRTTSFADRAAILDDHAANRVRHFACFTALAENAMAAIVERQHGAATAVFRYSFFFDKENKIHEIHRRPAIQADIDVLKRTRRGTACTDRFLAREETRLRRLIGGDGAAEAPPAVAPAAHILIESTVPWKSPPPRGRARNRVTVDLDVLKSIPKSTSPRGGG